MEAVKKIIHLSILELNLEDENIEFEYTKGEHNVYHCERYT